MDKPDRLRRLDEVIDKALQTNGGPRSWKLWKQASIEDLRQLLRRAPRVHLLALNLEGDLHAAYQIDMPIPRWPHNGQLVVGHSATFHLAYHDEWRTVPPKGWEPVGIFAPPDIFHPDARPSLRGALCLGRLPAGVSPKELLLLSYLAGTMQTVQLAEDDPEGVLNVQACEFFRCHPEYLPLTWAGLCEEWQPEGGV
jgi:hypothetical protein